MPWKGWLKELQGFVADNSRLPRRNGSQSAPFLPKEKQLGVWCNNQRRRWKGNKLTAEEAAALEAIPGWYWEQHQRRPRAEQLHRLARFVQEHGRLPRANAGQSAPYLPDEGELGNWCSWQRQRWKGKQQPPLTAEEAASLAAIPGWLWEQWQQRDWEQQCQAVAEFQRVNGRLPCPKGSRLNPLLLGEGELGNWCDWQRQRQKGNVQPPLLPERQAALETIPGWSWDRQAERRQQQAERWEQQCQAAAEFLRANGRLPRTKGSKLNPLLLGEGELGRWCDCQRQRQKGNVQPPLSAEQEAALEASLGL